jgi:hypothetical protein
MHTNASVKLPAIATTDFQSFYEVSVTNFIKLNIFLIFSISTNECTYVHSLVEILNINIKMHSEHNVKFMKLVVKGTTDMPTCKTAVQDFSVLGHNAVSMGMQLPVCQWCLHLQRRSKLTLLDP